MVQATDLSTVAWTVGKREVGWGGGGGRGHGASHRDKQLDRVRKEVEEIAKHFMEFILLNNAFYHVLSQNGVRYLITCS